MVAYMLLLQAWCDAVYIRASRRRVYKWCSGRFAELPLIALVFLRASLTPHTPLETMRQASSLALLGLAAGAAAQTVTAPYTDPLTGIDFQAYTDPETGYIFGVALPETVGTDFIGQIVRMSLGATLQASTGKFELPLRGAQECFNGERTPSYGEGRRMRACRRHQAGEGCGAVGRGRQWFPAAFKNRPA